PQKYYATMVPFASNSQGTVVGSIPSGDFYSNPWYVTNLAYTQLQPDGSYNGLHGLTINGLPGPLDPSGYAQVNDKNEILYFAGQDAPPMLLDLNTGKNVPVSSLISPQDLAPYSFLASTDFINDALDANGDILALAGPSFPGTFLLLIPP